MEDSIEVILQDRSSKFMHRCQDDNIITLSTLAAFSGFYGLWTMFMFPGFLKVPFRLKVPYMPSSTAQTQNAMKLLEGRKGRLADLGSGDGRLVFAACSLGFQCTGFEINSVLRAYSRTKARWKGIPQAQANFVNKDFWKTDLSEYHNVTVFLAPAVMEVLEKKLLRELPQGARVVVCRFPFPRWPPTSSSGSGLDQAWAYDVRTARRTGTQSLQV